ncbi:unnamed protein product [Clavelina lepadiformis]|uniref:Uncharacterized protein n=1 Tax=Clavelina lepadiformis TaxID=159417 RepID=A0ABP0FQY9_CLALP
MKPAVNTQISGHHGVSMAVLQNTLLSSKWHSKNQVCHLLAGKTDQGGGSPLEDLGERSCYNAGINAMCSYEIKRDSKRIDRNKVKNYGGGQEKKIRRSTCD